MGCHTWCYAHIPEKEKEWEEEYKSCLIKECNEMIKHWNEMDIKSLQEFADEYNNDTARYLKAAEEAITKGDISNYVEYFGSEEKFYEYYDKQKKLQNISPEDVRKMQIDYSQNAIDKINECDSVIDFIEENFENYEVNTSPSDFHLFEIYNHKIYRDTCAYRGPGYMENPVFDEQFGDMFRIYDYEAKSCHSLQETLDRCKEYDIDWNATYPNSDVKINNIDRIYEFWETYPDGIISFG